jgi:hypothetical protein
MFKKVGIKLEYKYDELQKYDRQVGFLDEDKNREIVALKKRLKKEKIRGLAWIWMRLCRLPLVIWWQS